LEHAARRRRAVDAGAARRPAQPPGLLDGPRRRVRGGRVIEMEWAGPGLHSRVGPGGPLPSVPIYSGGRTVSNQTAPPLIGHPLVHLVDLDGMDVAIGEKDIPDGLEARPSAETWPAWTDADMWELGDEPFLGPDAPDDPSRPAWDHLADPIPPIAGGAP